MVRRRHAGAALLLILACLVALGVYGLSAWRDHEREHAQAAFRERALIAAEQLEAVIRDARPGAVATGRPGPVLASSFGSAMDRIPMEPGTAALLASHRGAILAAAGNSGPEAVAAIEAAGSDDFGFTGAGDTRKVYAASMVDGTTWQVVLAGDPGQILDGTGGPTWIGWAALVAFTLTGGLAVLLVMRVQRDARRIASFSEDLERRRVEAEEATRAKNDFLSGMTHELRTPLAAIRMFTDLMRSDRTEPLGPGQIRNLDDISASVTHLVDLLDDTMDIARIEQGRLPLRPERVGAAALAIGVVDGLQPLAIKRGIELTLDADGGIGEVYIDPARFRQVLINFLSNSLKFTPAGGRISARVARHGPSAFIVSVEDTGIGMTAEDADKVFSPDAPRSRPLRDEDTTRGLGLALTRRIVEAMGGHVGVDSAPGEGSTFYAVLPCVNAERYAGVDPGSGGGSGSVLRAPAPAAGIERRFSLQPPRVETGD